MKNKILIYGFGDFPLTMLEVFKLSNEQNANIDWGIILPTSHHYKVWVDKIESSKILLLSKAIKDLRKGVPSVNLKEYSEAFYRDLEVDKLYYINKSSQWREQNGLFIYQTYKSFLMTFKPDIVVSPSIQSVDGTILIALCKEIGIKVLVSAHTRILGRSFWALDQFEKMPLVKTISTEALADAKNFLHKYRESPTKANSYYYKYNGEDAVRIGIRFPNLIHRSLNHIKRLHEDSSLRTMKSLRVSILNNLPFIRDTIRGIRKLNNKRYFQIGNISELPERFVFYPLQYSPEASINIPAPYFADQSRAIDLIRMNMPSDYLLVIKEHPDCISIRNRKFIKRIIRLPGVRVAKYDLPSQEIIEKSSMVISVTGTATLEAFMFGKPSLTLGDTFFSDFLGGTAGTENLKERIELSLEERIDDNYIIECIAKVLSVCQDFTIRTIYEEPTLYKGNIKAILHSIQEEVGTEF